MPDYYEFCSRVRLVAGHQALEELPSILSRLGTTRPMVLTDQGVASVGLLDILLHSLGDLTPGAVEDQVPPDSDLKRIQELTQVHRSQNCDGLIALGGGSVLDTAKGINILISMGGNDLMVYTGANALTRPLSPLVAIPTTAGSGSEVTLAAVIADHEHHQKLAFISPFLQPHAAVLDSRMTQSLPPHITAATGMDALAHALEASYCLGHNPLSDAHAHAAIEGIRDHLVSVVKNPRDKDGRLAMAMAATLAGMAFSNSMVGMVHTLGHAVGGVCGIPHGTCMAVLLPHGMEYNMHKEPKRMANLLLPLAGSQCFSQTPRDQRPARAVEAVRELNQRLNQATKGAHVLAFKDCKTPDGQAAITEKDFPAIVSKALGDGSLIYNPEDMDEKDLLTVLEAAWEGVSIWK